MKRADGRRRRTEEEEEEEEPNQFVGNFAGRDRQRGKHKRVVEIMSSLRNEPKATLFCQIRRGGVGGGRRRDMISYKIKSQVNEGQ